MRKIWDKTITMILAAILPFTILTGCQTDKPLESGADSRPIESGNVSASQGENSSAASADTLKPSGILDLFAAGDNILHQAVIDDGKTAEGYDYTHYYEHIAHEIEIADVAFINQESPLGGEALGIGGYPNFNSPQEIGDNLVSLGFDVINQANNHMLDKGSKGVRATLEFWKKYPQIKALGINGSEEEQNTTRIVEHNGIKLAFLSYTYGTNGYKMPKGQEYLVNLIERGQMKADVERAKTEADAIVVSMHWGVEYSTTTSSTQHSLAQYLADLGVDLVIGHHPHVIQRVNWVTGEAGNKTLVYYSLGNFLSSQERVPRMLGAAAKVRFEKKDGDVSITSAEVIPTVCHFETNNGVKEHFKIYKLSEYTDELAKQHGVKAFDSQMTLGGLQSLAKNVLKDWYTDEK